MLLRQLWPRQHCPKYIQHVWKILCNEITLFIKQFLPKYHCVFREGFSVQHYQFGILVKWKRSVDQGQVILCAFHSHLEYI